MTPFLDKAKWPSSVASNATTISLGPGANASKYHGLQKWRHFNYMEVIFRRGVQYMNVHTAQIVYSLFTCQHGKDVLPIPDLDSIQLHSIVVLKTFI